VNARKWRKKNVNVRKHEAGPVPTAAGSTKANTEMIRTTTRGTRVTTAMIKTNTMARATMVLIKTNTMATRATMVMIRTNTMATKATTPMITTVQTRAITKLIKTSMMIRTTTTNTTARRITSKIMSIKSRSMGMTSSMATWAWEAKALARQTP
jgi:hypothetical protein